MTKETIIQQTTRLLEAQEKDNETLKECLTANFPANDDIDDFILLVKKIIFPMGNRRATAAELVDLMAQRLGQLVGKLPTQHDDDLVEKFVGKLPELQRLLIADALAISQRDPAVESIAEVISCYPAITVMLHYRVAHALYELQLALLPRIITERAHSLTGIDIHPAATIGRSFAIDHGTGIVIGATTRIGNNVMLYQGVTLGAKRIDNDADGRPLNTPRHPNIQDDVTIYSNTSVLGNITIGHHSTIGGNLWITRDVPPYSQVRQSKPIQQIGFTDGEGI